MTTVLEKFGLREAIPFIPKGLPGHSYDIKSTTLVGIEVEVENVSYKMDIPRGSPWRQEADGSLRNNGMEFVSKPIPASYAPGALQQLLSDVLNQDCHFSPRTSVHVHLNAQDMEMHQVYDLVLIYSVFERLLYKFAGRGRIRNIFCVPITESNLLTGLVDNGIQSWSKYTGLNLCPLFEGKGGNPAYGTIEFRHMHGTFSVEKLCLWLDLITSLKDYIMKSSTKDIRSMILSMDDSFNFNELLYNVFGKNADVFKFCGLEEVKDSYLAAKLVLVSQKSTNRISAAVASTSPFNKFKG